MILLKNNDKNQNNRQIFLFHLCVFKQFGLYISDYSEGIFEKKNTTL